MELLGEDIEKLLLAALLGAIIGLDREYRNKPAGFRTLLLVSLGAGLFTMVSFKMALSDPLGQSDVTRIASNIITGIGFIGAGIIFRNKMDVQGITTSATVWTTAAIGMAVGIGAYGLAVVATIVTWLTLFVLQYVESMMEDMTRTVRYRVSWQGGVNPVDFNEIFEGRYYNLKETKLRKSGEVITAEWTVKAARKTHEDFVEKLILDPRIVHLEH
jgi:putative Mg2+ transporter-C (MgtC) family protein